MFESAGDCECDGGVSSHSSECLMPRAVSDNSKGCLLGGGTDSQEDSGPGAGRLPTHHPCPPLEASITGTRTLPIQQPFGVLG